MSEPTTDDREKAEDAIRAAMEARHGGLVSDIPTGARNWGEADGYWITMHVEPVLDALIALGWGPTAILREQRKEYEQMPLAELFTSYRDGQEIGWEVEFAELREREGAYLERLAASIHENGMHTPILLGKDGRIWDGHHRLYVARLLGMATVPVIRASVNIPDAPAGKPVAPAIGATLDSVLRFYFPDNWVQVREEFKAGRTN